MNKAAMVCAALSLAASFPMPANADAFVLDLNGPGVAGRIELTYAMATDARYPQGFEVTGISGTYSDSNNGLDIVNAAIDALVPVTREGPGAGDPLAPSNFSRFPVATGLPPFANGVLTYANLLYPGGSPRTGRPLDDYGLLFSVGGGRVVNLWWEGDTSGGAYSVVVATSATFLSYATGIVASVPEPSTCALLLAGLGLGGLAVRHRTRT